MTDGAARDGDICVAEHTASDIIMTSTIDSICTTSGTQHTTRIDVRAGNGEAVGDKLVETERFADGAAANIHYSALFNMAIVATAEHRGNDVAAADMHLGAVNIGMFTIVRAWPTVTTAKHIATDNLGLACLLNAHLTAADVDVRVAGY